MLDQNNVRRFLESLGETGVLIANAMEQEDWVLDDADSVYQLLIEIGKQLESIDKKQILKIHIHDWIAFFASISYPRFLIAASKIEEEAKNTLQEILDEVDVGENSALKPYQNIVKSRLLMLYRMEALKAIFSPQRAEAIIQYLEQHQDF